MAQKVFKEAHNETCDAHQVGPKLDYRIDWFLLANDDGRHNGIYNVFHTYQVHANFIHDASEYLYLTTITWPFEIYSMNVIGSATPISF